jgi:pyrroloquinoline quinone biosynthesis protein B
VKIRVLGSAAGGGFPQWNCNCRNCAGLRAGTLRASPRTQSSIAVSDRAARDWVLINASPDILTQLRAHPVLARARAARDTAIAAIMLVDAQIDHTVGLFMLRESPRPLALWCTDAAYADLTQGNPILEVLAHYCGSERHALPLEGAAFSVPAVPGLSFSALAVPGKAPPFSPHRAAPAPGDNVALLVRDGESGRTALYAPGLAAVTEPVWEAMRAADCLLLDGTFWSEDEMARQGLSAKRARDMGHLPQSGPGGMLERLARLPAGKRRILIHVNNSNPILDEDSPERAELARAGVEVAYDGMEIEL